MFLLPEVLGRVEGTRAILSMGRLKTFDVVQVKLIQSKKLGCQTLGG